MKFVFLAGGFAGFLFAGIAGLSVGRAGDMVLRDAALGCLAGALLFRWFWSVLVRALSDTLVARRAAAKLAQGEPSGVAPARAREK